MIRKLTVLAASFICAIGLASAGDSILPAGSAPPALVAGYFPNRLYEFVWRNWNAVPPQKLADILGCSPDHVVDIAASMGLPREPVVVPQMRERGYVTLIRRNWHLLPYAQLLQLLDLTPERLSVMLREEDFLWHKLGQLKPQCDPLHYTAPDDAARTRAAEIRAVVQDEFGDAIRSTGEPRFDFVRQMQQTDPDLPVPPVFSGPPEYLRIVHSYVAVFGDPLLSPELNPYPDGLLQRLAASGINGVWMHALLRDLAPGGAAFPEFGTNHEKRMENLRQLVARTKKFGIDVYLYLNEPRAMPHAFFKSRPDLAGVREAELTALCTSQPAVRDWMGHALEYIFREVPGLGGVYTITASENLTNCASHGDWTSCPRCKARSDADIIAEVNTVIEQGVHRGNPNARVLVSDWGWRGHGDAPDIIALLPKSIWLMSVSEWHLPIERGGIKSTVGEYSISAVGPGPRSLNHWKAASERGLKIGTEIQFNNTCEIATVPYLPVLDLIAEHCDNLRTRVHLNAMFIGWTMGGYPSPNFQLAARLNQTRDLETSAALDELAIDRFGPEGGPHARRAWTLTSNAFREYPFHISVVYTSPVQWGAANPLYPARTGYSATMWGIPYDDLDGWRGPYPPDIFADQFDKVASGWRNGIAELALAVENAPADKRRAVEADLLYARAAGIHFQSVANQARFVHTRNTLLDPANTLSEDIRRALREKLKVLINAEKDLARESYDLSLKDSRIGFEPSCQYFYLPLDLVEKVIDCRWLLDTMDAWCNPQ